MAVKFKAFFTGPSVGRRGHLFTTAPEEEIIAAKIMEEPMEKALLAHLFWPELG